MPYQLTFYELNQCVRKNIRHHRYLLLPVPDGYTLRLFCPVSYKPVSITQLKLKTWGSSEGFERFAKRFLCSLDEPADLPYPSNGTELRIVDP